MTALLRLNSFPDRIFEIDCACMSEKQKERLLKHLRFKAQKTKVLMTKKVAGFAREYFTKITSDKILDSSFVSLYSTKV